MNRSENTIVVETELHAAQQLSDEQLRDAIARCVRAGKSRHLDTITLLVAETIRRALDGVDVAVVAGPTVH